MGVSRNFMKRVLTIFSLVFSTLSYSQLSNEVSELVNKLSNFEQAESRFINYGGTESDVYKIYDSISKIASKKEVEYLAFNGAATVKLYFSNNLVDTKSKKLKDLFKYYLKNNDSVNVKQGCVVSTTTLVTELYSKIYNLPRHLVEMEDLQQAIKSNKYPIDEQLKEILDYKSKWNMKEAKKMVFEFDKIVLDDKNSPLGVVEYICKINQYYENKIPYFQKLQFFEKKYNSKIIAEYIAFCENK